MDNATWMSIFASLIGVDIYHIVKDKKEKNMGFLSVDIFILIICIVGWLVNCAEYFNKI